MATAAPLRPRPRAGAPAARRGAAGAAPRGPAAGDTGATAAGRATRAEIEAIAAGRTGMAGGGWAMRAAPLDQYRRRTASGTGFGTPADPGGGGGGGGGFGDFDFGDLFGGGDGDFAAPGTGGSDMPPEWAMKAEDDPFLRRQAERIEGRLQAPDVTTQRMIEKASGAIRDLGAGQEQEVAGQFARLGAMPGEAGAELESKEKIREDVQSQSARAASDIALGRERDYDALLLGATGGLGARGAASRAERELGLRAWSEMEATKRAREAARMQAAAQRIGLIQALIGMFR